MSPKDIALCSVFAVALPLGQMLFKWGAVYNERLTNERYRASPIYADGKIYTVGRDSGTIIVVKAGRTFQVLGTSKLNDEFNASPAVSQGRLYLRGLTTLYAISEGGKLVLGAQAGPKRLEDVFRKAGFTHFRRAAETPFNLIFEIRR
mgnify:CR=1 FL=1